MAENILTEGITLYNQKKYAESLAFFLSLPSDSGADKFDIAYYLGLCYAKLQKYDDALLYLEQVVTTGGILDRVLQCRFLLAVIYALSGRKKLAEFELNKLLDTGFMTPSVYAAIAFVAWEQNDTEKCISYYEEALKYDSENLTSMNGLGYVLACQDKDLTRALSLCKKSVDSSPNSAACLDSLGWVYFKLGLYDDAKKYLNQASSIDSSNPIIAEHIKELNKVGKN